MISVLRCLYGPVLSENAAMLKANWVTLARLPLLL